ncbi:MAG: general secretion pathway protein I [Parasphingorhabdus sp.]|jgi:general secretion pathway protein I
METPIPFPCDTSRRRRNKGFTLLEVLAALAIASTGLLAVAHTVSTSVDVSAATEGRTVALWVASNAMAELRLSQIWPAAGSSTQQATMAGRKWVIKRTIEATADADIVKVELQVLFEQRLLSTVKGYLARLDPPRKSVDGSN